MLTKSFEAWVENGRIQPDDTLAAFEGQRVRITLTVLPILTQAPAEAATEPPEGLEVEKDVYVKMPLAGAVLKGAAIVDGGPLQPCIILPEEAADA